MKPNFLFENKSLIRLNLISFNRMQQVNLSGTRIMKILLILCISLSFHVVQAKNLWLPVLFSNNMVLQQKSNVPIWGKALPESEVIIVTTWNSTAKCKADAQGKWKTYISTPAAGGPYAITISTRSERIEIFNVLIGEVWLCSGQSNMEMPLAGWPPSDTILGATAEINHANNNQLRTFTVKRAYSPVTVDSCIGEWVECNPQTAGMFSATAYFFGKKLYETLNVPIGLIHTSWGGTPAEAWTDKESLMAFPEFAEYFNKVPKALDEYNKLSDWIKKHPIATFVHSGKDRWKDLDLNDATCSNIEFNDNNWLTIELPQLWEQTSVGDFDGAVWFRKTINIPENWANKDLELCVGKVDDMDATYFNGQKIGGYEEGGFWQTLRVYKVPASMVKAGKAAIAIRVIDTQGGGGIYGEAQQMYIKPVDYDEKISLAGTWKFMPAAEFISDMLYVYDIATNEYLSRPKISVSLSPYQPAVLFNAMINPIIPFTIKGAIWYQGESNVGRATQYEKLFGSMITGWRRLWQQGDFPFYYVQIAPWKYSGPDNDESGWLREAQRRVLNLPNTGMAVTLDIGNVENIHPARKKEVGERLALWALAKDYGKNLIYSGPMVKSIDFKNGKAYVSFSFAENGLVLKQSGKNEFEIAEADGKFVPANVKIENNKLIIWNDNVKNPTLVRYAFKNGSEAVLFNAEGLPASGFTNAPMQN